MGVTMKHHDNKGYPTFADAVQAQRERTGEISPSTKHNPAHGGYPGSIVAGSALSVADLTDAALDWVTRASKQPDESMERAPSPRCYAVLHGELIP